MNTYDDTPLTFLGTLYTFAYSKVHAGVFNRLGFPVGLFIAVSGPGDGSCHIVYAVGNSGVQCLLLHAVAEDLFHLFLGHSVLFQFFSVLPSKKNKCGLPKKSALTNQGFYTN